MAQQIRINRNDLEENGMNEYERITDEWNQSNEVQEMHTRRSGIINNTPGYYTGNRIHHLRSIQMHDPTDWNQLFGRETLNPLLREYAQASMEWINDETETVRFAGQMDVSLLLQENFRPGVHVAVLFVHLSPHRHFHDGHVFQFEFGEGSQRHQTLCRLFDTNERAIVLQATEYQMLEYLADDDEALDLLHNCFLQPDFSSMRFRLVENSNDDQGIYVIDPTAADDHRWHDFTTAYEDSIDMLYQEPREQENRHLVAAAPPPPPINNFVDIYLEHLRQYDEEHDNDDEYDDDYNYNNIHYNRDSDSDSEDDEPEIEVRG